jgi:hypothetical protein
MGGDTFFVGRALELGTLDTRLERAIAGAGSLVIVAGDAGIGKTRMLREFTAAARARGALTLWGSSFEGDWHPPYGPWVEALGEAGRSVGRARLRAALGRGAPVLARLVPELDAAIGGDAGTMAALSPEEERFRLYDAVARFLVAVARQQPTVLVLDDLHWTDRDSLQLLAYCGRFLQGHIQRWERGRQYPHRTPACGRGSGGGRRRSRHGWSPTTCGRGRALAARQGHTSGSHAAPGSGRRRAAAVGCGIPRAGVHRCLEPRARSRRGRRPGVSGALRRPAARWGGRRCRLPARVRHLALARPVHMPRFAGL